MREKTNPKFFGIVLCIGFGLMLIVNPSCQKDRASADQFTSLGIPAPDHSPSWSPDGKKIAFVRNEEIYVMDAEC